MDFQSMYAQLKGVMQSPDDISKFVANINLLSPSVKLSLAKGVLDFMETNPLVNDTILKGLGASWTASELKDTREKLAIVEKTVQSSNLAAAPEPYPYTGEYVSSKPVGPDTQDSTTAQKVIDGGEVLWNAWLTRVLKGVAIMVAIAAVAVIAWVAYQKWDVIKDKLGELGEQLSEWFNFGSKDSKVSAKGLAYPFEADKTLMKEASLNFTLLEFIAATLGLTEQKALYFVQAVKSIDPKLVQSFIDMEKRIADVRSINKGSRPTAVSYVRG